MFYSAFIPAFSFSFSNEIKGGLLQRNTLDVEKNRGSPRRAVQLLGKIIMHFF